MTLQRYTNLLKTSSWQAILSHESLIATHSKLKMKKLPPLINHEALDVYVLFRAMICLLAFGKL